MEYIIQPSWVYWISVLDALKTIAIIGLIFSVIGLIIGICEYGCNAEYGPEDHDVIMGKRIIKITAPLTIILGLGAIFIPSERTLIKMMVMQLATKENVDITVEGLKSVTDYIIEAIKSLK